MKKKESIFLLLFFLGVTALFFYKTIFFSHLPIPGDLLIAEYNPWKSYSYLGYTPGSFPNKAQYFDVIRQLLPWKSFAIDSIKQGNFPLWNPYNFAGTPLFANFQSGVLYPLNIFYFVLPFLTAWSLLVILQPVLALVFMYYFARKIGIGMFGAIFAAVSYAFSSFMTVWLEYNTIGHILAWLPFALLATEHLLKKVSRKWILSFVISLVTPLFAGHPQVYVYFLVFLFAYIIFRVKTEKTKNYSLFFILLILAIGIGAIQILPGLELIKESARVSYDYRFFIDKVLIQPYQLLMIVVQDFFGNPATRNYFLSDTYIGKVTSIGLVALVFVVFSLKAKNIQKIFFIVSSIVIFFLTTVNPVSLFLYQFNIPFVSSSAPTLGIFLFSFSLSILSGIGIDEFLKNKYSILDVLKKNAIFIIFFVILLILLFIAPQTLLLDIKEKFWIAARNTTYVLFLYGVTLILLLIAAKREKSKVLIIGLLLCLQIFDVWRGFQKFNPFTPAGTIFPKAEVLEIIKEKNTLDRVWGYGSATIDSNFETYAKIFSPQGYDPLYNKQYGKFIYSSKEGVLLNDFDRTNRADAIIAPADSKDLLQNEHRLKILDLLSTKYIFDRIENNSHLDLDAPDRFNVIYKKDGWLLFENKKALSRAFLAYESGVYNDDSSFEKQFFSKSFDPSKKVLLEKNITPINSSSNSGKVTITSYVGNKKQFKTQSKNDSILFISDSYYPGWNASIDGSKTDILRANYTFQALRVPAGDHTVDLLYDPFSFRLGFIISVTSLIATVLFVCLFKYVKIWV